MKFSYATSLENHAVGDRVEFYKDSGMIGSIVHVEDNKLSCMVLWDGDNELDFQWSNKLRKIR